MTLSTEISDLCSSIDFVRKNEFSNIGVVAASFGGNIAPLLPKKYINNLKALCLWNPCLNYDHCLLRPILPHYKPFIPKWKKDFKEKGFTEIGRLKLKIGKRLFEEMRNLFPYEKLKEITIPTAIVHGTKDTYVPYDDSKEYTKYLKNGKFISIENGTHGFQEKNEKDYEKSEAIAKTVEFFKNNL